jgi:hypothetical protein
MTVLYEEMIFIENMVYLGFFLFMRMEACLYDIYLPYG